MPKQNRRMEVVMRFRALLKMIVLCAFLYGCASIEQDGEVSSHTQLIGAWLIAETSVTTPEGTTINENPQPGVYIFTERHFSNMLIPNAEGRPPFSTEWTDAERLAAYDNFIADSGSYELTDSSLTTHNIIAKVPNVMDASLTYQYSLDGDSLVLTLRGGWAPPDGEITYRLDRLK